MNAVVVFGWVKVALYQDPKQACLAVVKEAQRLWLKYETRTDDISIIVVHVDGLKDVRKHPLLSFMCRNYSPGCQLMVLCCTWLYCLVPLTYTPCLLNSLINLDGNEPTLKMKWSHRGLFVPFGPCPAPGCVLRRRPPKASCAPSSKEKVCCHQIAIVVLVQS